MVKNYPCVYERFEALNLHLDILDNGCRLSLNSVVYVGIKTRKQPASYLLGC